MCLTPGIQTEQYFWPQSPCVPFPWLIIIPHLSRCYKNQLISEALKYCSDESYRNAKEENSNFILKSWSEWYTGRHRVTERKILGGGGEKEKKRKNNKKKKLLIR